MEQQLATQPAEEVHDPIFRTTSFHLMTLGLTKIVINWRGTVLFEHFL